MSKKTLATAEPLADADRLAAEQAAEAEAARLAAEAEAEAAARAEAERLAAEQAAETTGVLLRRENIAGTWYPHGGLLTCSAAMADALERDSALDLHPDAVAHAIAVGAPQLRHVEPSAE